MSRKKELKSTRDGFGAGLLQAGEENEKVVALSADLTESTRVSAFAEKFPKRFTQVGVAEQNLVSVASGMATMGKIPFATSFAIFSPGRSWEQIRTTICYNNTNVKIVGSHAGVVTGPDGGSHQMLEDIALTRVLPRMTVFSPADFEEAKQMTLEATKINGPVYLRLSRMPVPAVPDLMLSALALGAPNEKFGAPSAKASSSQNHAEIGIMATGHLVHQAVLASQELEQEGIKVRVINLSRIKPLNQKLILEIAKEVKGIVTVEDHQLAGGVGSAVAELLSQKQPTKIEFVAVKDKFGQSGKAEELLKLYELDSQAIKKAVYKLMER